MDDLFQIFALLRLQRGVEDHLAEADDGVHRCPDFVAHPGQEVGLGPVGTPGLGDGFLQGTGPVFDHRFQRIPITAEFLVARLQTVEHAVETLSQAADFVLAPEIEPLIQAGVARNPVGELVKLLQRGDQAADCNAGEKQRDEQCQEQEEQRFADGILHVGMVLLERDEHVDPARRRVLSAEQDGLADQQMVIGQRYRRALLRKGNAGGVRAAVFGQRCAVLLPGAAGHDGRVDGQRSEQALGFPGVAEGQCGLRVVGQQARLGGHGLGPLGLQQMPLLGIDQPENEADDDEQEEEGERNKLVADVGFGRQAGDQGGQHRL